MSHANRAHACKTGATVNLLPMFACANCVATNFLVLYRGFAPLDAEGISFDNCSIACIRDCVNHDGFCVIPAMLDSAVYNFRQRYLVGFIASQRSTPPAFQSVV
jgi:hypothetical protein